jgi:hypothetical protein
VDQQHGNEWAVSPQQRVQLDAIGDGDPAFH